MILHVVEELQEPFCLCARQIPVYLGNSKDRVASQSSCSIDRLLKTENEVGYVRDAR